MLAHGLILLSLFVAGFAVSVEDCPSGIKRDEYLKLHDDTCYEFVLNSMKSFQDAQDYCGNNGGKLAVVTSDSLNQYLKDTLLKTFKIYYSSVWIGLKSEMGEFKWVDGSEMNYNNIDPADSKYTSALCASIVPNEKIWSTYLCTPKYLTNPKNRFICQYPVSETDETHCPVESKNSEKDIQELGSKCYYFGLDEKLSFPKAKALCEQLGGRLALIKSKEINEFLQHHLTVTHKLNSYTDALWIGLKYSETMSGYLWLDNTPMRYSNFNKYTSSTRGKCAVISPFDGTWRKYYCTDYSFDSKNYICEFDKKSTCLVLPTVPPKAKTTTIKGLVLSKKPTTTTITTKQPTTSNTGGCSFAGYSIDKNDLKLLNDKCYFFSVKNALPFQEAKKFCKNQGGELAMPKSKKINEYLVHHMQVTHRFGYSSDSLWIGLEKSKSYYPFHWADNTAMDYKQFQSKYPDGDCASISPVDGDWETDTCSGTSTFGIVKKGFICQFDRND